MQIREFLSILLVSLLCVPFPANARMSQTAPPAKSGGTQSKIAEKVVQIPEGTQIEVILRNKDTLKGRLGPVSQESFRIQYARGEKVIDREVPFDQVKSFKKAGEGSVSETPPMRTVQQQVVEIPTGKLVEVHLNDKSKIRGRIGQVSADGFMLTAAKGNQVGEQKLAFTNVTSIKAMEKEGGVAKGWYVLAGAGAAVVVLLVVAMAAVASGS